jgi:hypothetical protein
MPYASLLFEADSSAVLPPLWESPELWRWSSYRAYFLGETGVVKINEWEKMKIQIPAA